MAWAWSSAWKSVQGVGWGGVGEMSVMVLPENLCGVQGTGGKELERHAGEAGA